MQLIITPNVQKHFKYLPKDAQTKIKKKVEVLGNDPLIGKKLSGELSELHSLRVWPYRVVYYINSIEKRIYITAILHRQGAYK